MCLLPASVSHSFNRALTALARLEGRGGAGEQELPQHFGKRKHSVSAASLLSVTLFLTTSDCVSSETRHHHHPLHHHAQRGLGERSGERAAHQSHEHHFCQCLLLLWEPGSHCEQHAASLGLRELLASGYEVAAVLLGSRQDIVKGELRGMATSLMTSLAACQGAM